MILKTLASYIRKLKDRSGNYVLPAVRASCVYFDDNTTLSKSTFYPVGSIYMSTNNSSPAALFGGSWSIISGKFLLGQSSSYALGSTGGSASVKLKVTDIPKNPHQYQNSYVLTTNDSAAQAYVSTTPSSGWGVFNWRAESRDYRGSEQTLVNTMPPYLAVNIWERTA